MAERSAIEWTDSTFNPWVGCTKISPACDHCYAEGWAKRSGQVEWGNHDRRRTSVQNWNLPLRWQREAAAFEREYGRRRRVFCASLADVFDNQVPAEWRHDLWSLIERCWGMDWLLLTKRPQNIEKMLPDAPTWENIRRHVWLGTTVEDQDRDRNILHLLRHDAAVRFVSYEPALGPLDLSWAMSHRIELAGRYLERGMFAPGLETIRTLNWVIAGGESGPQARPSHPDWFRSLRDQCAAAGVPFLFKQWGEYHPAEAHDPEEMGCEATTPAAIHRSGEREFRPHAAAGLIGAGVEGWKGMCRVGKKRAGRLLDRVEHNGFPTTDLARVPA